MLRNGQDISLCGVIKANDRSVRVVSKMKPRFLETSVTHAGKLIAEFRLHDGLMVERGEFIYQDGSDEPISSKTMAYSPPYPDGTDSAFFSTSDSCLYGSYMRSWAGPDSYFAGFLERRIAAGTRQPDIYIGQERCRVIRHQLQLDNTDYVRIDEFVFGEDSKLLKQWNTHELNPSVIRLRTFDIQITSTPSPTMAASDAR